MRGAGWIVAAAMLAACQVRTSGGGNEGTVAAAGDDPQKIVEAIEKSWSSGSTEAVMANYAPDFTAFTTGDVAPTTDRNFFTRDTAGFMAMKPADFVVTDPHIQTLDEDTIVSSGVVSFTANMGPGRPVMRVRFTQVIEKQDDGRWLIAHEHMSLPPEPIAQPTPPPPTTVPIVSQ